MNILSKIPLLLVLPVLLAAAPAQPPAAPKVAVIVHTSNPAESLSVEQIRALFLKKSASWKDALADVADKKGFDVEEKVRPVDTGSSNPERAIFLQKVLDMTSESLDRYWVKVQYQHAISGPKNVENAAKVITAVAASKGGLGFVPEDSLTEELKKTVKVVLRIE